VIHRDLKPLNVMVGAFGEVQVMDWGLAKRLRDSRPEMAPSATAAIAESATASASPSGETADYTPDASDPRTQAGQVMGTFAYMPPEQARGEVQRLDERSDVFGLGAILCQILTGQPPYRSTGKKDLWRQAREGDLSDALARLESCGAETELIALTKSYLTAEPEERPAHAGVVAEQITAHVRSVQQRLQQAEREKAVARAKAVEERKRRRWQLALAASVLLLLLGGGAAAVWYYQDRATRAVEEARQQSELAARQQLLDRDVTAALDEAQRSHDDLYGQLADERAAQALLSDIDSWQTRVQAERSAWQRADRLAAVDSTLLAAAVAERLRAAGQQIEADEADWRLAKKLDDIRLETTSVGDLLRREAAGPKFAAVFHEELNLDLDGQDPAMAARAIRQSRLHHVLAAVLDHWAKVALKGQPRLLTVARLADPDPWRDRVRDEQTWTDRAKLEQLAREGDVARQSPQILLLLAQRLRDRGGDDRALLRSALAVYPRDFWLYFSLALNATDATEQVGYYQAALAVRPNNFMIHDNLGCVLSNTKKDFDTAVQHHRMALKLNPNSARIHYNLGVALYHKGDLDGAIRHCETAVKINPIFASAAHTNIGLILAHKHDLEGAIRHYRLALQADPKDVIALVNLSDALGASGNFDEAAAAAKKALQIDANNTYALTNLAQALQRQKKLDEAIAACRKAIAIDGRLAEAYMVLGSTLSVKGEVDEAITAFRKALTIDPTSLTSVNSTLRYNAACSAALAGWGKSKNSDKRDEAKRGRLRQQGRDWLQDDLRLFRQKIQQGDRPTVSRIAANLSDWQQNADLAGVREAKELAKLPEAERQLWQRLWTEVKELEREAQSRVKEYGTKAK
jgi:tetratricopeptide (TPR) repeat protein